MTMTNHASLPSAAQLSDQDLLDATVRVAAYERRATAELIALLAELDSRGLYLGEGYSSLFMYCRHRLHLSEFAAYSRITAARVARRFSTVLVRLAEGALTLTSIGLLAPHLTDENHEALLDAVQHLSRRDVERLVANLYGQPDIPASVRRLPDASRSLDPVPTRSVPVQTGPAALSADATAIDESTSSLGTEPALSLDSADAASMPISPVTSSSATCSSTDTLRTPARRDLVAPLAVDRYLLRVTIGAETNARLDRARDLLRHVVPNGDIALVLDRALAVLVDQLERRKTGRVSRPRKTSARSTPSRGRHIPAAVKREVQARDGGRCAFVGPHGRCSETGFLEYHHVLPYARGGAPDTTNIELRCRAHNAYEAMREFAETSTPGRETG